MESKRETIFETILKVRKSIAGSVEKDGQVTSQQFSYKYASHNNIVHHVRSACNEHGLLIIPQGVENPTYTKGDTIVSGNYSYLLANKPGDTIIAGVYAAGEDKGDKLAYKLDTGAMKYLHIQLFMLATDLDPENPTHEEEDNTADIINLIDGAKDQASLKKIYDGNENDFKFSASLTERMNKKLASFKETK